MLQRCGAMQFPSVVFYNLLNGSKSSSASQDSQNVVSPFAFTAIHLCPSLSSCEHMVDSTQQEFKSKARTMSLTRNRESVFYAACLCWI